MTTAAYDTATGTSLAALKAAVAAMIAAGFQPTGSAYFDGRNYCQAMTQDGAAVLANGGAVAVHNSAGANVAGVHTAEVANGALTDVKLAATVAPVVNGQALAGVAPTGAYTNTVTFTVANGVITAIALS